MFPFFHSEPRFHWGLWPLKTMLHLLLQSIDKRRLLHYHYSVVKLRLSILSTSGLQLQEYILR